MLTLSEIKREVERLSHFLRYLSLAPVLAVLSVSIAFSTWAIFNRIFPDLLFQKPGL
ncbi:MAG: PsaJ protein [Heteroscytonema crispum UTEX LB 1556]